MKKSTLLLVSLLVLSASSFVFSQSSVLDSLTNVTSSLLEDSVKVDHLLRLSIAQSNVDNDLSKSTSWAAKNLAQSIEYTKGEANAYNRLSYNYQIAGDPDSALLITLEGYNFSKKNGHAKYESEAAYLLGGIYSQDQNMDLAFQYYTNALDAAERIGDDKTRINVFNGLGVMMMGASDMAKSIDYLKKGLNIALENQYENLATRQYINLSIASDSIEESSFYLDKAIHLAEKNNNIRALGYAYNFQGDLLVKLGKNDEALKIVKKSYAITKNVNDIDKLKNIRLDLAELFYQTNAMDSSNYYYIKYLQDTSMNVYSYQVIKALKGLSRVNKSQNKPIEAYVILDSAFNVANKYYKQTIEDNINDSNTKYETEKKDAELVRQELEITKSKNQKSQILGISILLLLLISSFFLWYYERQKRKKKEAELELEHQKLEAKKLKEMDEMKSQFFTNISHELRTPLTLILGPLNDVLEKTNDAMTKKSVHLAHSNADRLLDMVNEVLDLSKLESGNIELLLTTTELNTLLKRVVFAFASLAEIRNIELKLNINFGEEYVLLDVDKLEKILNNLISNAIKFSSNNSEIIVNANFDNANLTIDVIDNGKGIMPDEIEKIFNRFYQSSTITTVEGGGTGVGLALSRELTELFGGNLSVKSKVGQGSRFTLRIPVSRTDYVDQKVDVAAEHQDYENVYSPILINGQKPHILIVEDNDEMSQYLSDLLSENYRCSFAKNGYEAIQKIQTTYFDVVSSDIMMPLMDGLQLKEKVNTLRGKRSIPFIFLSARSLEEDIIKGLQLGVDDYITKPFNKQEYRARINNLIKNKKEREDALSTETLLEKNTESVELELLKKAELSILKNISNTEFKVPDLASDLNYSQRQLARIIKKLTGMTPVNFILELRLQRAYHLIKSKKFQTITEVMYEVGIGSSSYFTRKFKERFGLNASEV